MEARKALLVPSPHRARATRLQGVAEAEALLSDVAFTEGHGSRTSKISGHGVRRSDVMNSRNSRRSQSSPAGVLPELSLLIY